MELDFDTDQEDLRDAVRTFLGAECPVSVVRDVVESRFAGTEPDVSALTRHVVELGWPALTVPESAGGLGLGPIELALVAEELGRALAPGPLGATLGQFVPVVTELAAPEQLDRLLGPVVAGRPGTLAVAEPTGALDPARTSVIATPTTAGYVLEGTKCEVVEPAPDGALAVVARTPGSEGDDGVGVFVVPVATTTVTPTAVVDPSRVLATVRLEGVEVAETDVLGAPGPVTAAGVRRALEVATVAIALDAVGAAQQLFDLTLTYVGQREQFGVPIGSFQAVKHKLADLAILIERARSLGYFAALTIAEDDGRRTSAAAMAKAAAGDAAERAAKEGIQLHGGIGYTWESDVHLYVRRLQSDAVLFGTASEHRQVVADQLGV